MKRILYLMIFLVLTGGFVSEVKAQGEAAVPFLLLAPDSRAGGIGESGGGLADNSSAVFWNPAGIAFLTGSEVSITHSNWLPQFNLDLFYEYLTYRQYIEDIGGSFTASITYMNYGEFIRTDDSSPDPIGTFRSFDAALTLGYAAKVSNDWGLGFNFRLIHSRLADQGAGYEKGEGVATSVSFDIATMWRPTHFDIPFVADLSNKFSMGINLSNLGPKIYYIDQAQADPIPTNFRLGFAVKLMEDQYNSLTYTLDFSKLLVDKGTAFRGVVDTVTENKNERDDFYKAIFTAWADEPFNEELRDIVTSMGLEYWYGEPSDFMFALRGGFFYEDPSYGNRKFMTLGAGLRYDIYGFDFSYITTDVFEGGENHPLNNTLRFTVSMGWGPTTKASQGFPRGI
ncbi:MAG: type IX secretion system outer membrane channel protein PorV [Ignavibacteriales bacterium]|nr:type IX secretion system outer membrane channel protein PorV [Ignavibacteriales bacterium]MCF8305433.1 type IX secretion system outer membrane channel protein PorV [Ignavibacteriales bacterium]MCF8316116.1 type IX secretion system outer membrane channel protein PorV [Ignavibacteriales bacterium]MCF8436618.1 type IX secretion system outer membrane channel protein PorV [Ignavibacteriales bacterium]